MSTARVRNKNSPPELERNITRPIHDYLEIEERRGHLLYIRNNTGATRFTRKDGKPGFIKYGKKGSPDFIVWKTCVEQRRTDRGVMAVQYFRTFFLEVKTTKGKQSEGQKEFQEKTVAMGGDYFIVRSLEDVINILL